MAETYTFVVNDESVLNTYGGRVLTSGLDIKQYKKNPIVLWFHKRPKRYGNQNNVENEILPIGTAVKLWKDDGKLFADIQFDQEDEFAQKIEGKVARKIIRMCSPGIDPVAFSEDTKHHLPGQTRVTITKGILDEISIVDIGGNNNALRLSDNEDIDDVMPKLNLSKNKIDMDFKTQVAAKLGIDPNSADNVVLDAIGHQITLAKDAGTYKTKFENLEKTVNEDVEKQIIALVDANVDKKFTADKKESMVQLGKTSGLATLQNVIGMMPDSQKPTDAINQNSGGKGAHTAGDTKGDSELTFAKLKDQGLPALEKFKADKPAEYIVLFKAEYGFAPDMD